MSKSVVVLSILAGAFLGASGCVAPVGSSLEVPSDAAVTCQRHCYSIGMTLSAVAIMASNVGCICQNPRQVSSTAGEQESVTAGMATIMLQEEETRHQRMHQTQQQQTFTQR